MVISSLVFDARHFYLEYYEFYTRCHSHLTMWVSHCTHFLCFCSALVIYIFSCILPTLLTIHTVLCNCPLSSVLLSLFQSNWNLYVFIIFIHNFISVCFRVHFGHPLCTKWKSSIENVLKLITKGYHEHKFKWFLRMNNKDALNVISHGNESKFKFVSSHDLPKMYIDVLFS